MESVTYVSLFHQMVMERQMEAIAHNLANMNTPAFKGERSIFEEFIVIDDNGEPVSYVAEVGLHRDMTGGPLETTGSDLDVALDGNGWFVVETENGERYTRQGHFGIDENRQIVTSLGDFPLSQNGDPFTLRPGDISVTISRDGTVSTESGRLGRFRVVQFENEQDLIKVGPGLFAFAGDVPPAEAPSGEIKVHQGAIEQSNIQPVLEMTRMIGVMRSYQSAQRLMQTSNDLQLSAIEEITATG